MRATVELCGVTYVYHYAVAVYPDVRGCGQVSTVDGNTGRRGPTRTAYADTRSTLSSDGTTVLAAGDSRLEMWRSDMVRMLSLRRARRADQAGRARRGRSAGWCRRQASSSAVSVLEACPAQADLRLTLLQAADQEDAPNLKYVPQPGVRADSGARVLAVSDTATAVYLPDPQADGHSSTRPARPSPARWCAKPPSRTRRCRVQAT